ncbi:MAG: amidase [Isosphaeraceae bacterium]
MKLLPDDDQTIAGTARSLLGGQASCVDVLWSCLERIDEREPEVQAWVAVDRAGAESQARSLDDELRAGRARGPLHGIPIGIKDIIDVRGFPTLSGLSGRRWLRWVGPAGADAPLVARLRRAGAVILGKTVSTPFAWIDPPATRNPWDLDRTPGGSSSGSAAAVACGMCLGAIGTQTGGSIIRPASFCGVAGFKPSYGRISTRGVVPLAPSLDHPGPIARSVGDLQLLDRVLRDSDDEASVPTPEIDEAPLETAPRLVALTEFRRSPGTDAIRSALEAWRSEGATTAEDSLPVSLHTLLECHRTILAAEAAAVHGTPSEVLQWYFEDGAPDAALPNRFADLLREGSTIPAIHYINALRYRRADIFGPEFPAFDALVTCATVGPAPDTSTTGDPMFNSPWSLLGLPSVSFPVGLSADGLPLAVQLIGRAGGDLDLLRTARWCESVIRSRLGDST